MYDPSTAQQWWPLPDYSQGPPVCWARFPYEGPPYLKSPWDCSTRPCLILSIEEAVDQPKNRYQVVVAMGTKNATRIYDGEFFVEETHADFKLTTLKTSTRFKLKRMVPLYFNSDWFEDPAKCGHLSQAMVPDLKLAMKEADFKKQVDRWAGVAPR